MDINSKNTLVTAYSYKLNKEIISKLLKNINLDDLDLENNEYYVNIYTKFKKIKKIEIKDIVTVNINNDNIVIDYQIESSSFKINYDKVNKNIDFITYLDNVKVSEYNVAKTDSLNINLKLYNDGDIAKELKITLNKNDVDNGINYIISINGNYKLDILLSYDVNNLIDVSNNRVLSEEEVNEVNKYIYDSLSNMNIFQIFSY